MQIDSFTKVDLRNANAGFVVEEYAMALEDKGFQDDADELRTLWISYSDDPSWAADLLEAVRDAKATLFA